MDTVKVDKQQLLNLVKLTFPEAVVITDPKQVNAFQEWREENKRALPEAWTLKEFAKRVYHLKSTKRAFDYLCNHRDELDIQKGGFIDFDQSHNGWHIPAEELIEFNRKHHYRWE